MLVLARLEAGKSKVRLVHSPHISEMHLSAQSYKTETKLVNQTQ